MSNSRILLLSFVVLLAVSPALWPQDGAGAPVTIMSYNVENLFDAQLDGTEYPEYRPGNRGWNDRLFHTRLSGTARIVREAVPGGPDIIVLLELENRNVLSTLAGQYLGGLGYRGTVMVPVPGSAINVGVLSRFPVVKIAAHEVHTGPGHPLRNILEIHFDCSGVPLVLFACHWKSKSGGAAQTEDERLLASRIIVARMRAILSADPSADVVVAGDLNENVDEYEQAGGAYETAVIDLDAAGAPARPLPQRYIADSIFVTGDRTVAENAARPSSDAPLVMFTPWSSWIAAATGSEPSQPPGSYWYRGRWETIDQFLLSSGLLDSTGFTYQSFEVVAPSFLLNRSGHPSSWQTSRARGYSDHLPILLTLSRRKAEAAGRE